MAILSTDPIDFLLGSDGDLAFAADGDLQFSHGIEGVEQAIRIAVNMAAGEWFLDRTAGVPWFEREGVTADQAILGQPFDRNKIEFAIRDAVLGVPGVARLASLTASYEGATRTLIVTWEAITEFGDTIVDSLIRGA